MAKSGIKITTVKNKDEGIEIAKDKIYNSVSKSTVLFLSGGSTPKPLYRKLAQEKKLRVGAVAMVDERYGAPFHSSSNEKMMQDSGLLSFLTLQHIPFRSILKQDLRLHPKGVDIKDRKELAKEYNSVVNQLLTKFTKSVAILGIGEDGHIAGIPPRSEKLKVKSEKFVESFEDFPGEFRERITLTFKALSMLDLLIVLVFGEEKKKALDLLFSKGSTPIKSGSIEEIPARFLKTSPVSERTLLITDQKV